MNSGNRRWRVARLFSYACLLAFGSTADKNEPADGIQTKHYEHPRFGDSSIRYCVFNQYYDEHEGRCVVIPGGGSALSIDNTTTCNTETLRPHPSHPNYYYACRGTKTIFAKCPDDQQFENRLKRCAITNMKQCNEEKALEDPNELYNDVQLPPCKEPGRFPICSDNFIYYTCTSNGFRLYREIHRCPLSHIFDPDINNCMPDYVFNKDSTSKNEPLMADSVREPTIDINQLTTARPVIMTITGGAYDDQVISIVPTKQVSNQQPWTDDECRSIVRNDEVTKSTTIAWDIRSGDFIVPNVTVTSAEGMETSTSSSSTLESRKPEDAEVTSSTNDPTDSSTLTTRRYSSISLLEDESTVSSPSTSGMTEQGYASTTMTDDLKSSTNGPWDLSSLTTARYVSMGPLEDETNVSSSSAFVTNEKEGESTTLDDVESSPNGSWEPSSLTTIRYSSTSPHATTVASIGDDQIGKINREDSLPHGSPSTNVEFSTTNSHESIVITAPATPLDSSTSTEVPLTMETTMPLELKEEESTISPSTPSTVAATGISEKKLDRSSEVETTTPSTEINSEQPADLPSTVSGSHDKSTIQEGITGVPTTTAHNIKDIGEAGKRTDGLESTTEKIKSTSSSIDQETLIEQPWREDQSTSIVRNDEVTTSTTIAWGIRSGDFIVPNVTVTSAEGMETSTSSSSTLESRKPEDREITSSTNDPTDSSTLTTGRYSSTSFLEDESTVSSPLTSSMTEQGYASTTMTDDLKSSTNGPWDLSSLTTARYVSMGPLEDETNVSSSSAFVTNEKEGESTTLDDVESSPNGSWEPSSLTTIRYSSTSPHATTVASIGDDQIGKINREDSLPHGSPSTNVEFSTTNSHESIVITAPATPSDTSTSTEVPLTMETTVPLEVKEEESTISSSTPSTVAATGISEKKLDRSSEVETTTPSTEINSEQPADLPSTVSGSHDKSTIQEGITGVPTTIAHNIKDIGEAGKSTDGLESTTEKIKSTSSSIDQETLIEQPWREDQSTSIVRNDEVTTSTTIAWGIRSGDFIVRNVTVTSAEGMETSTSSSSTLESRKPEDAEITSSTNDPTDSSTLTTGRYSSTSLLEDESTVSNPLTSGMTEQGYASTTMTDDLKSSTNGPWDLSSLTTARYVSMGPLEDETNVSSSSAFVTNEKEGESTTLDDVESSPNGSWEPSSLTTIRYSSTSPHATTVASIGDDQIGKINREDSLPHGGPSTNVEFSTTNSHESIVITAPATPLDSSTSTEVPLTMETTMPLELKEEESTISPSTPSTVAATGISEKKLDRSSEVETTTPSTEINSEQPADLPSTGSGSHDKSTIQEGITGVPTTIAYNIKDIGEAGKSTDGLESTTEKIKSTSSSIDQETLIQQPWRDDESTSIVRNDEVTTSTTIAWGIRSGDFIVPNVTVTSAEGMEMSTSSSSTLESREPEDAEVTSSTNDPTDFSTLTTGRYSSTSLLEGESTISSPSTSGMTEKEDVSTTTDEVQSSMNSFWEPSSLTTIQNSPTSPLEDDSTVSSLSTSGMTETSGDRWTNLYRESGYIRPNRTNDTNGVEMSPVFSVTTETATFS